MISLDVPARQRLRVGFDAALAVVDGGRVVRDAIRCTRDALVIGDESLPRKGRVHMVAVGKAAGAMAAAFEEQVGGALSTGLVVTKERHATAPLRSTLVESAHPVPDARSVAAADAVARALSTAEEDDTVCVLLSGGTSSLLASPLPGLSLDDLAATTRLLLEAGADIHQTNAVRKQLTRASGGRLARCCRARRTYVLAISDVPGDAVDVIGSGPFAADLGSAAHAASAVSALGIAGDLPESVRARLEGGAREDGCVPPGDPALRNVRHQVLASNRIALAATREAGLRQGVDVRVVSPPLEGEARDAGRMLVDLARRAAAPRPTWLLAGGETFVTVRGPGRGGRNQELALAAALALEGAPGITLLAAGTDGTDGPTPAAGAFADAGSVARGAQAGVRASDALAENDAYRFFAAEGGLLETGPTGTNVMDLVLIAIDAREAARRAA